MSYTDICLIYVFFFRFRLIVGQLKKVVDIIMIE